MKKLFLLAIMLQSLQLSAQSPRTHYRLSEGHTLRTQRNGNGVTEVKKYPHDTLTVNTFDGKIKAQNVRFNKKWSRKAILIKGVTHGDSMIVIDILTSSLICEKISGTPVKANAAAIYGTPIPLLYSDSSSAYCIYLNFDTITVNNPNWNATAVHSPGSGFGRDSIIKCFGIVANKYSNLNICITTDKRLYLRKAAGKRVMVVITTNSAWYGGYGGVAYVGSFGYTAYDPAWIFSNNLSMSALFAADAIAHEVGHTLGLSHQGQFDINGNRLYSYNNGNGVWGPIMGDPYNSQFVQWASGPGSGTLCSISPQDDLKIITTQNSGLTYKSHIAVKTLTVANGAFSDSGYITNALDSNVFLLPSGTPAGVKLSSGAFTATISGNQIKVSGAVNPKFWDNCFSTNYKYGCTGAYKISGTVTGSPHPDCSNFKVTIDKPNSSICQRDFINVNASGAAGYSWTGTNAYSATNALITVSPQNSTTYTVTGTSSNGCTATATAVVTVLPQPVIQVNPNKISLCKGNSISITSSGATSYSWNPPTGLSVTSGQTVTASPSATTTYTITGAGGTGCTSLQSVIVTVKDCNTPTTCPATTATYQTFGTYYKIFWSAVSGASYQLLYTLNGTERVYATLQSSTSYNVSKSFGTVKVTSVRVKVTCKDGSVSYSNQIKF